MVKEGKNRFVVEARCNVPASKWLLCKKSSSFFSQKPKVELAFLINL